MVPHQRVERVPELRVVAADDAERALVLTDVVPAQRPAERKAGGAERRGVVGARVQSVLDGVHAGPEPVVHAAQLLAQSVPSVIHWTQTLAVGYPSGRSP